MQEQPVAHNQDFIVQFQMSPSVYITMGRSYGYDPYVVLVWNDGILCATYWPRRAHDLMVSGPYDVTRWALMNSAPSKVRREVEYAINIIHSYHASESYQADMTLMEYLDICTPAKNRG
jgi:hypothetical protein